MRSHKGLRRSGGHAARLDEESEHQKYLKAHPELTTRKRPHRRVLKNLTNPAPRRDHPVFVSIMDVPKGITSRQKKKLVAWMRAPEHVELA